MTSYCRSSWWSASLATPETVPVISPVVAKKTGLPKASDNTGTTVSVNVRRPVASLKRPVSTSDLKVHNTVCLKSREIDAIGLLRETDLQ